jgi:hypothetical protein
LFPASTARREAGLKTASTDLRKPGRFMKPGKSSGLFITYNDYSQLDASKIKF